MPLVLNFNKSIPENRRTNIRDTYQIAANSVENCTHISREEKNRLNDLFNDSKYYRGGIITVFNTITDDASINAEVSVTYVIAGVYQATVAINFNNMNFDNPGDEERQTIIHEMMHVQGYDHPDRCDVLNSRCNYIDDPMDGGPYYGSPPLRSELCIAGMQSLVASCSRWKGSWTVWKDSQVRREAIIKELRESDIGLGQIRTIDDLI